MPPRNRKIAIVGYRSVGKTSLTIQYVDRKFVESYDPTIENTFTKSDRIGGHDYFLRLVDTAGQDEYSIFPTNLAIDVHGYCFVYSINNRKSFEVVKVIYEKLFDVTGPVRVPIVLVGNKLDLNQERVIDSEEGKQLAETMKAQFFEVSAKNNQPVTDLFQSLILAIERVQSQFPENQADQAMLKKCLVS